MPRIRRAEEDRAFVEEQGADYLEVLARGLRIMGLFNAERRRMTLSELAQIADAPRSSVHRVLLTLEKLGFAEQEGRYFKLTPRVLTLAAAVGRVLLGGLDEADLDAYLARIEPQKLTPHAQPFAASFMRLQRAPLRLRHSRSTSRKLSSAIRAGLRFHHQRVAIQG